MAASYFVCLTADGGVPLFTRTKGNINQLPFPLIGSLNGVHMFCKSHDVQLKSATTEDSKIVWKSYHNSINLVLVTLDDQTSDSHLTRILDYVFQAMVLVYGQEDLINIKNVERFKREIKVCYKLIDRLLEQGESPDFGIITNAVDLIAGQENTVLQSYIDAFTEAADSPYGCLLVAGKVAVATRKWWEMSAPELLLLTLLVSSLPPCSSRDVAVFLPDSSPTVPHRLLTFQILQGVEVCLICGPTPTLVEVETEIERYWRPVLDSLKSILRIHHRSFPTNITLDPSILGLMLVNPSSHRCLCSVHPHNDETARRQPGKALSALERRSALRAFYKSVMGGVWSPPQSRGSLADEFSDLHEGLTHIVTDTYICSGRHKAYAMRAGSHDLFVLYSSSLPTYAMRSITQKTLQALIKDKNILV